MGTRALPGALLGALRAFHSHRPDPEPSVAKCLEWIASAQEVLVVGYARESLLERLDARGCAVTCLLLTNGSLDEPRVFCSAVHAASPDDPSPLAVLKRSRFDAVVFDGALDLVTEPADLIAGGRSYVRDDGALVALFSSSVGLHKSFDRAGYRVEGFERFINPHDTAGFAILAKPVASEALAQIRFQAAEQKAERRRELHSQLDAYVDEIESLHAALAAANGRVNDLERAALRERITLRAVRSDVEVEKIARSGLQKLLDDRVTTLADLRRQVAQAEDAWYALYDEADIQRALVTELESVLEATRIEAESQRNRAQRMSAAEAAINAWAEGLQETIEDLRSQIVAQSASEREAREHLVHLDGELENSRRAVIETERRLSDEIRELQARVADAEHALATQTDSIIDTMRAESTQLSTLIDAVQSSRFWRLKRWLNRLRGRTLRS